MIEDFIAKVEALKKNAGVDLSIAEDLSIAVMNLISLEEHFFFTAEKTSKDEYFDTIQDIRAERKNLLAQLMPDNEGETWCVAKHLLATTMRLIEVGNKLQSEGEKKRAKETFDAAYRIYSLFWALKAGLVRAGRNSSAVQADVLDDLVKKLANCCDE